MQKGPRQPQPLPFPAGKSVAQFAHGMVDTGENNDYLVGAVGLLALTENDPLYDKYWEIYHDNPFSIQYAEIFE